MGYGKKDELDRIVSQVVFNAFTGNRFRRTDGRLRPSVHECPFCQKEFEGVPKWCPHCRKRVTKPGTSELICD